MSVFDGLGTLYWNNVGSSARAGTPLFVSVAFVFPISKGWFGLGFPPFQYLPGQGHINTDMILMAIDSTVNPPTVSLSDRWSVANDLPGTDVSFGGKDNLIAPQGIVTTDGRLYVRFRRLYSTGDVFDQVILTNASQPCLFAYSPDAGLNFHGRANQQSTLCNFGNVSPTTAPTNAPRRQELVVAHGVLGAFGIGLFLTFGGFFYRYFWCVPLGARLMLSTVLFILGGVLVIISFIIAGVMVSQSTAQHFSFNTASSGAHGLTALVTMICVVVFLFLRLLSDCILKPSKRAAVSNPENEKAAFYRLASYSSWVLLILSCFVGWPVIFLGFVDLQNTWPWLWVIGGILIGVATFFAVAEIIKCIFGPKVVTQGDVELDEVRNTNNGEPAAPQ